MVRIWDPLKTVEWIWDPLIFRAKYLRPLKICSERLYPIKNVCPLSRIYKGDNSLWHVDTTIPFLVSQTMILFKLDVFFIIWKYPKNHTAIISARNIEVQFCLEYQLFVLKSVSKNKRKHNFYFICLFGFISTKILLHDTLGRYEQYKTKFWPICIL